MGKRYIMSSYILETGNTLKVFEPATFITMRAISKKHIFKIFEKFSKKCFLVNEK